MIIKPLFTGDGKCRFPFKISFMQAICMLPITGIRENVVRDVNGASCTPSRAGHFGMPIRPLLYTQNEEEIGALRLCQEFRDTWCQDD